MSALQKTILAIFSGIVLLIIAFWVCSAECADFTYTPPTNNKYYPIIMIENTESLYACSAFVISDTIAITASHCVQYSSYYLKNQLAKDLEDSKKTEQSLEADLKLLQSCMFTTCMEKYYYAKDALQKEIFTREKAKKAKPDKFSVFNSNGEEVETNAIALYNSRFSSLHAVRDYAQIKGNFKKFNKLPINTSNFFVRPGDNLTACGYAEGITPLSCTALTAISNFQFRYSANGYIVQGMSGGPVFDSTGTVVGIISSVELNRVNFTPTIGIGIGIYDE